MPSRRKALSISASVVLAASLVACGGSDDVPSATLNVTPALGATYGASVTVFNGTTGIPLGSGITGAASGSASIPLVGTITGPIVVKVTLSPGSSYFDEKTGRVESILTSFVLLTALPALPDSTVKSVGVTPLTNMAAKLAGLDSASSNVIVTADKATEGAAKTVLALGLPASFNITSAPIAAKSLTSLPTDVYGLLLAEMAKRATTDALSQAKDLADAVTAGVVVASGKLTTITTAVSSAATAVNTVIGAASVVTVAPNLAPTSNQLSAAVTSQATAIAAGGAPTGATGGTGAGSVK